MIEDTGKLVDVEIYFDWMSSSFCALESLLRFLSCFMADFIL